MKLVLDTNAYTGFLRGDEKVIHVVRQAEHLYLPATVVGELLFGFRGGNRYEENVDQLRRFLDSPLVDFSETNQTVCHRYALVLQQLRSKGRPIPTNDVWIAAHALALGADLLSWDQHFSLIEGLSWIGPRNSLTG